ncbi:MAG: PilZ domain-containing protein [Syntrophales bacterium]
MNNRRKYQRYAVNNDGDTLAQGKVKVEGELVRLVDFSLAGLYILSKKPFSTGLISISVEFGNQGKLDLIGSVVRVKEEGYMWCIAIDLTQTYKLNTLRKV